MVDLEEITPEQFEQVLDAAEVIGDDHIQATTQGRVHPEAFTHRASRQRQLWFYAGYRTGDIDQCDTFSVRDLDDPPAF